MAEVSVAVGTPIDLWEARDDYATRERQGRQRWADIPHVERAAAALIVSDLLLRLLADIDRWLPAGFELSEAHQIDIRVSILVPEMRSAGLEVRMGEERQRVALLRQLGELYRSLQGG